LRCCVYCGRDTRSRDAVYWTCHTGSGTRATELRGRHVLPMGVFNDSPMDPYHEDDEYQPSCQEEYDGDTYRDDL
jgi:hypothetical protein